MEPTNPPGRFTPGVEEPLSENCEHFIGRAKNLTKGCLHMILQSVVFFFILRLIPSEGELWLLFSASVALSAMIFYSQLFTVSEGSASLQIMFEEMKGVLKPGLWWELSPLVTHSTHRVDEFTITLENVVVLGKDQVEIKVDGFVRMVVTDLRAFYNQVVLPSGGNIQAQHKILQDLVSAQLRNFGNMFASKKISGMQDEMSRWIANDEKAIKKLVRKNKDCKDFPKNFRERWDAGEVFKKWGIGITYVVINFIRLPKEVTDETSQADARMEEMPGMLTRAQKIHENSGGEIPLEEAMKIVQRQENTLTTVEIVGDSKDDSGFLKSAAVTHAVTKTPRDRNK